MKSIFNERDVWGVFKKKKIEDQSEITANLPSNSKSMGSIYVKIWDSSCEVTNLVIRTMSYFPLYSWEGDKISHIPKVLKLRGKFRQARTKSERRRKQKATTP